MKKIDIIAVCSDLGVDIFGSSLAPEELLKNINPCNKKNITNISKLYPTKDYIKELNKNNMKKNINEINKLNKSIYNNVRLSILQNNFPIILGGDHSIAIGSALASQSIFKNMGIIWFDAHGDFNTLATTSSGNIHGLPFATITGYDSKQLSSFYNGNYFDCKKSVLFGARDIDFPNELNNLKNSGITIITTDDIKKYGYENMTKKALEIASNNTNGIHISYDIDCIDSTIAPGVSTPVKKGLNEKEALGFLNICLSNDYINKIKSFDIVEYNPINDIQNKTKKISSNILNIIIDKVSIIKKQ